MRRVVQNMAVMAPSTVRIAVVGDVHGSWKTGIDQEALRHLQPDIVLFTGDFGNENVKIVKDVAKLEMPKAVILGNHDCWWSGLEQYRENKFKFPQRNKYAVMEQITELGDSFVGFKRIDFDHLKLSVVGVRPFSIGGKEIFGKQYISDLYGIKSLQESAAKIAEVALSAPEDHSLVFLGHNGPTGLGSQPADICGKDFEPEAGDHGDADLEEALEICQGKRNIPLVCFGHMHKDLAFNLGERKMLAVGNNGTIYLNGAVVPRARNQKTEREFAMVELTNGRVNKVTETWVQVTPDNVKVVDENVLFSALEAYSEVSMVEGKS